MLKSYFCVGTILAVAVAVMLAQGPAATKVAFVKDGQIYVADGTGGPAKQITFDTPPNNSSPGLHPATLSHISKQRMLTRREVVSSWQRLPEMKEPQSPSTMLIRRQ